MSKDSQRLEENYILRKKAGAIKTTATSILLYLAEAYFWAVKDHFAEFWPPLLTNSGGFPIASWEKTLLHCSPACREQVCQRLRQREEYKEEPMLQSAKMMEAALKAVDTRRINEILRTIPLAELKELVRQDIQGASEEKIREFLQTLDMAAYFKMNYAIDHREKIFGWLQAIYPDVAACTQQEWSNKNDQAVRLRNRLDGHLALEDLKKLDPAEWKEKCEAWLDICGLLSNGQMMSEYKELCWDVNRSVKEASYVMVSVEHLAEIGNLSIESTENILREVNLEVHAGHVFCESETAALRAITDHNNRCRENKMLLQLHRKVERLQSQQPRLSEQEAGRQVVRAMLESKVAKLPHLRRYERGVMNPAQLRELAESHMILLDGSVLKSKAGRDFLLKDLLPHLPRDPQQESQATLVVEATTRYHIFQEKEQCKKAGISGSEAGAAYVFMEDALRKTYGVLRYVNTPDPSRSDEEAMAEYIRTCNMKRICVLTYGPSPLAKMLSKEKDPLCVVGRLMRVPRQEQIVGGSGFGCMIFEHLLPFVADPQDPALLDQMLDRYYPERPAELSEGKQPDAGKQEPENREVAAEAQTDAEMLEQILAMPLPEEEKAARRQEQKKIEAEEQDALKKAQEEQAKSKLQKPRTSFAADAPLRKLDDTLLPLDRQVQPGDVLRTSGGGEVRIKAPLMEKSVMIDGAEKVAEGGEGTLYTTDVPGQVAKLYHRDQLTQGRKEKLEAMIETRVKIQGVCWPSTLLYRNDQFVGYLMPQAPKGARALGLSVLQLSKEAVQKGDMHDWDRMSLVQVAKAIANAMNALHNKNILMGDVNAANFLIVPEDGRSVRTDEEGTGAKIRNNERMTVYLVDCDSYQFDGYPCPVGMEVYTHPGTGDRLGIQGPLQFGTFLRTREEEEYALAILLFEILMLGQSPFSNKAEMNFVEAMKQRVFPYTQEEAEDVPEGDAWMIWKNLTKNVQSAFLDVFKEWKSVSARDWVKYLEGYANAIKKFNFSRELIPTKYVEYNKENPVFVDLVCAICGKEFNKHKKWVEGRQAEARRQHRDPRYLCGVCTGFLETLRPVSAELTCDMCGRSFTGTREQGYLNYKFEDRLLCQDCANPEVTCAICGTSFRTTLWKKENHTLQQCESCMKLDKDAPVFARCESCGDHESMTKGRIMHARFKGQKLMCGKCLRQRR